jgi:IS605 OrfB family transposase
MLLAKKIRIEVTGQGVEALEFQQAKCRGLYNWWVMKLKNGERWNVFEAKQTLQASKQYDPELNAVYGKLLHEVYFRLDHAMQGFFRRVQAGDKPGFPRFKPRHQFFTLCYPAMYLKGNINGKTIILPTGGGARHGPKRYPNIIAHLTEEPPAHFHEVAVSKDAQGHYYCSFVYDDAEQSGEETDTEQRGMEIEEARSLTEPSNETQTQTAMDTPKPARKRRRRKKPSAQLANQPRAKQQRKKPPTPIREDGIIAFDLGIKTLATGYSDEGRFYHIGGFKGYRWYNKQLDKIRSKRDRCKKKSRRYIHLSNVYRRVSERKRNKQRDCLHKASSFIAYRLAERAVVIGDLSQRQMVMKKQEQETPKERRKRQIRNRMVYNDWGLYTFVQMLSYKCLRVGKELHIISERDTTKTCHRCGHKQPMPLWKRTYRCPNCGLVMDRDDNSAVNIFQRFVARLGPHTL